MGASVYVVGASVYVVAHKILVSAPVPLGFFGTLNWVGLVWGWVWGLKDLGLGLDNSIKALKTVVTQNASIAWVEKVLCWCLVPWYYRRRGQSGEI